MDKLRVSIIIEILGRPPEHVTEALNSLVSKLGAENGVKIIDKIIHEPQPVKDSQNLFTAFTEVEFEIDSITKLFGIIFAYLPSHVEIISPEKIVLQNAELGELGSRLSERLHEYDAVAKRLVVERDELAKKLYEVAPHLFQKPAAQNTANKTEKQKTKKTAKKKIKNKSR